MVEWVEIAHQFKDQRFVLATVVHVDGSAYRREGAKMLFGENGSRWGTISAGCLEEDLRISAKEVFAQQIPKTVSYDMSTDDDLLWGMGSGCNGKIDILLEPFYWNQVLPCNNEAHLPQIIEILGKRRGVLCMKSLGGRIPSGATIIIPDQGNEFGTLGDEELDRAAIALAKVFLQGGKRYERLEAFDSQLFIERYEPRDRLFLFGAGVDAEPVALLAGRLGFDITLIDHRPIRCHKDYFPTVKQFIIARPEEALARLTIEQNDYVIVMTHSFAHDSVLLPALMERNPYYLGVLGARARTGRLLSQSKFPASLSSPIGFAIGAQGPEEIAVSIMAELIAKRKNRVFVP